MANIAIYWDFENIHASLATLQLGKEWYRENRFEKQPKLVEIGPIMEYAASLGNININRAYANWTFFLGYGADLQTHTVDLVQLYPRGAHGKNGADIRLATDVIEDIARHPQIDTVVVVGGDSDYIAIAQRVRERGHRVVGIGVQETTNRYWISSCNEFKFYASLKAKLASPTPDKSTASPGLQPDPALGPAERLPMALPTAGTAAKPDPARAVLAESHALLRRAMNQLVAQSGGAAVKQTLVKQMMLRLDPAFDEANIGYRTFSDFLAGAADVVRVARGQHDNLVALNGTLGSTKSKGAPDLNPCVRKLEEIGIRLPDPAIWDAAMQETVALLGGEHFLTSLSDFKTALVARLASHGHACKASEASRVQNVLYRAVAFRIGGEPPSVRLIPGIESPEVLSAHVRRSLTRTILAKLGEPPDPIELSEALFGSAQHVAKARELIDWYNNQ